MPTRIVVVLLLTQSAPYEKSKSLVSGELPDWFREGATPSWNREASQTWSFRGSKSRNKVSVGEPAEDHYRMKSA
ncbi:unnamed protein product [Candida parapsilosis]